MDSKLIATGLGFLGAGYLLGWAFTADRMEAQNRRSNQALRDVIKSQSLKMWMLEQQLEEVRQELPEPVDVDPTIDPEEPEDTGEEYDPEVTAERASNLKKLISTYVADPEKQEEYAQALLEDETGPVEAPEPPFAISQNLFAYDDEEGASYDKITLTYYPAEDVLLDEGGEIVSDIAKVVGRNNLLRFGHRSDDPNTVFVRNRGMEVDYEVVREEENALPIHVKYGMGKDEFEHRRQAGLIQVAEEDR